MARKKRWLSPTKKCVKCGKAVIARNLCPTHYKIWRLKNVDGAIEKHRESQRGYSKRYRAIHPQLNRDRVRENRGVVNNMPDWYVRRAMNVPSNAPLHVISFARELLLIKRELWRTR